MFCVTLDEFVQKWREKVGKDEKRTTLSCHDLTQAIDMLNDVWGEIDHAKCLNCSDEYTLVHDAGPYLDAVTAFLENLKHRLAAEGPDTSAYHDFLGKS